MSNLRAIRVGNIFEYNNNTWRITGISPKLIPGDTFIVIFGCGQDMEYKQLLKQKELKILYDSDKVWNAAHGLGDRTRNLRCVVFEFTEEHVKDYRVRTMSQVPA